MKYLNRAWVGAALFATLLAGFGCTHVPEPSELPPGAPDAEAPTLARTGSSARLQGLRVSPNGRFLVGEDGSPFPWFGDTAWRLTSKPSAADVAYYLDDRVRRGFTLIQVDLGWGEKQYVNGNTDTPNEPYWRGVDQVLNEATARGLYIVFAVMWGWDYPNAFNGDSSKAYRLGSWLGKRYLGRKNILWIVSGEYEHIGKYQPLTPKELAVLNSLAAGLRSEHRGSQLMTIHPAGMTSSEHFHKESWLDFNMLQSGHVDDTEALGLPQNHTVVTNDYNRKPIKPVVEGEPVYEDTPDGIWILNHKNGARMKADVVRRKLYWAMFAGALGVTYGHNDIFAFHEPGDPDISGNTSYWKSVLGAEAAGQVRHLRALMEHYSIVDRVPDQSILLSAPRSGLHHVQALRAGNRSYALVYIPTGHAVTVDMGRINGRSTNAWWFSPRDGSSTYIGSFPNNGSRTFDAPGNVASGNDWVLVLRASHIGTHQLGSSASTQLPASITR
jgi:Protein of unknown function (DUF4038)/Putative collagen-binding domain of a collagenase